MTLIALFAGLLVGTLLGLFLGLAEGWKREQDTQQTIDNLAAQSHAEIETIKQLIGGQHGS